MFKHPFSFEGRIGRKEYAITFGVYYAFYLTVDELLTEDYTLFLMLLFIPAFWILIAQGSKRCHDLGKGGGWQLIPFYFFCLLFQKGAPLANEYGLPDSHPKDGIVSSLEEEIDSIGKGDVQ
jgi:uncharacterized membrane protein YhaH (DUF805 family)